MGNVCADTYGPEEREKTRQQHGKGTSKGNVINQPQLSSIDAGGSGSQPKQEHTNKHSKGSKGPPPRPIDHPGNSHSQCQGKKYHQEQKDLVREQPHHPNQGQHVRHYKDQQHIASGQKQGELHGHVPEVHNQQREQIREDETNSKLRQKEMDVQTELKNKSSEIDRLKHDLAKSNHELQDKTERLNKIDQERNSSLEQLRRRENEISTLNNQLVQLKAEKDNLLTRLSSMAGAKLTDNNPNITDLSDQNRPNKLAEQFAELYDNQWTDAFSEIESFGKWTEREIVDALLKAFLEIYTECEKKASSQIRKLESAIATIFKENKAEIVKPIKDRRKQLFKEHIEELQPSVSKILNSTMKEISPEQKKFLKVFLKKSLSLCWLIAIQDPPVFVDSKSNVTDTPFDKNKYREYTVTGSNINYIVWPVMYLHENGPVLCKGVAQGNGPSKLAGGNQIFINTDSGVIRKKTNKPTMPLQRNTSQKANVTTLTVKGDQSKMAQTHDPSRSSQYKDTNTIINTRPQSAPATSFDKSFTVSVKF